MKALVYISGILGSLLILGGICFRALHLPGGNDMLLLGLVIDILIFTPLLIVYNIRKKKAAE